MLKGARARKRLSQPALAAVPPTGCQRERSMRTNSGVKPSRSVAEALADVLAPTAGLLVAIMLPQTHLPGFGRFAQLATDSLRAFEDQQRRVFATQLISQAGPNEVKQLVNQNQAKKRGEAQQFSIEHNTTLADKAGGMHGSAAPSVAGK